MILSIPSLQQPLLPGQGMEDTEGKKLGKAINLMDFAQVKTLQKSYPRTNQGISKTPRGNHCDDALVDEGM